MTSSVASRIYNVGESYLCTKNNITLHGRVVHRVDQNHPLEKLMPKPTYKISLEALGWTCNYVLDNTIADSLNGDFTLIYQWPHLSTSTTHQVKLRIVQVRADATGLIEQTKFEKIEKIANIARDQIELGDFIVYK